MKEGQEGVNTHTGADVVTVELPNADERQRLNCTLSDESKAQLETAKNAVLYTARNAARDGDHVFTVRLEGCRQIMPLVHQWVNSQPGYRARWSWDWANTLVVRTYDPRPSLFRSFLRFFG